MKFKSIIYILILVLLTGCFKQKSKEHIGNVSFVQEIVATGEEREGSLAPDFFWYDESGKKVSFREYTNGKVVLVNFWATWCTFCKMTFSSLRAVNIDYADDDVVVIGIATYERTELTYRLDFVSKFVKERDMGFPVILDDDENSLWRAFGMDPGGVPTTVMIDRDGRIVKAFTGNRSEEGFAEEIVRLL